MSNLRADLPVQVSIFNPFKKQNRIGLWFFLRHALLPARWWSPGHCHIRVAPFVLHIPRRWWPAKKDGVRKCANCGRRVWMEGPPMGWCYDCSYACRQLQHFFDAPTWWVQSIQKTSKARDWFKA